VLLYLLTLLTVIEGVRQNRARRLDAHSSKQQLPDVPGRRHGPLSVSLGSLSVSVFDLLLVFAFLWPPYVIGQAIVFLPCGFFFFLSSYFFPPNLSGRRLDHTSTHGVALVRI